MSQQNTPGSTISMADTPGHSTEGAKKGSTKSDRLKDVQGGVIGFNKDHLRLVYANFGDPASARQLVNVLLPEVATGSDVLAFNKLYGDIAKGGGNPDNMVRSRWVNLLLTRSGLDLLQAPGLDAMPDDFRQGMAGRGQLIGDVGASAPDSWVAPFTAGAEPHMVLMVAADTSEDVEATRALVESIVTSNAGQVLGSQAGDARTGDMRGHEHFGFKDGISQPGIEGFTTSSHSGSIPAGEILIGYKDADGDISGQPVPVPPPAPTPYDPTPAPPLAQALPDWTVNGSFVVLRRLRQDVAAFRNAMNAESPAASLSPDQLAAKLVGRWPSGAPMEHVPGLPDNTDPSSVDASTQCPAVLSNEKIDTFDYHDDRDGLRVPRAAHIRKMNPRADVLADGDRSDRHRMVRRGITYGPEFQTGETPYGQAVPDTQDRGLLFINYQASISRTFEFVQSRWANRDDFQRPGDGKDPLASQDTTEGTFSLPPGRALTFTRWIRTTGGAYLFAPSITGLRKLTKGTVQV